MNSTEVAVDRQRLSRDQKGRTALWVVAIHVATIGIGCCIGWALPKQSYILKSPVPRMIDGGWFGTVRAEYRMKETPEGWMLFRDGEWVLWELDDLREEPDQDQQRH
jgi:hypothetical protein